MVPDYRGTEIPLEIRAALWDRYPTFAPDDSGDSSCNPEESREHKNADERYSINPKTVMKWKHCESVEDLPMGPKEPSSTILSKAQEAMIVTFRDHILLALDDCLYALQKVIPHLTCTSLHRCLQGMALNIG